MPPPGFEVPSPLFSEVGFPGHKVRNLTFSSNKVLFETRIPLAFEGIQAKLQRHISLMLIKG